MCRAEKEMAELDRMVNQKVQSLHERVEAKEDAFRVGLPARHMSLHNLHPSELKKSERYKTIVQLLCGNTHQITIDQGLGMLLCQALQGLWHAC